MSSPADIVDAGFVGLIGVAREDITPPPGIYSRNWGAAAFDQADSVHRPLWASVVSVRARRGQPPLVLASLDLGWWRTREDERHVRAALVASLGIGEERVIVQLTHTHSGPSICREDAGKPGGGAIAAYLDRVRDAVVTAAARALATERQGRLDWSYGTCGLACQRDQRDPARPRYITGLNAGASADGTLLIGRVSASDGAVRAVLVNYACHPTSLGWGNRTISPDFVGAMRETIESGILVSGTGGGGAAPIAMFLQGASGDLAPRRQYAADVAIADANGRQLGHAALATLAGMLPAGRSLRFTGSLESGAPLGVWDEAEAPADAALEARMLAVEVALKPMDDAVAMRTQLDLALATPGGAVASERLTRSLRVRRIVGDGDTARIDVWMWRIGGALLVGQMNEAYSTFQRALRAAVPGVPLVVLNHVNGGCGYLPPRESYAQDLYQVWQTPFASGSLEAVTAACASAVVAASASASRGSDSASPNPQPVEPSEISPT